MHAGFLESESKDLMMNRANNNNNNNGSFNMTGYRSNERDEGTELSKLTVYNAISCHQKLIEDLETSQLKLQQLCLHSI